MKNLKLNTIFIILIAFFSEVAIGQIMTNKEVSYTSAKVNFINDAVFMTNKEASYVSVNVSFINDAVFMGRKDSIATPYLYPSILYHNKEGFYASGSVSYLTASNKGRIDLFLITAGYDFSIKKLDGDISFTKYFFNDDSNNVISEVASDLTASLKYDFNVINLGVTANTYFNKNDSSDYFLSTEISHDFFSDNQKFQISPTAGVNFGTQNFYEEYYINNRFGSGRSGQGSGQGSRVSTQIIREVGMQESENFNLMAIEFSLPMWYVYDSFTFSFLPALVIPQNEATLVVDEVIVEEDLESTFYWVFSMSYQF
ncbi:hypothetical protein K8354_18345 [Polaribacter litorisediminis]|uniref:hypothetical protein n=1 Tax=Polaribacter litorisediminis TaxID=1908341 RepID=UPI001CBA7617|nr:hypothetical protein [Polaribacter litorisediminis]UAM98208.1 hypothetical protein K8354_18345 [Polaribacter litorisediminis]